MNRLLTSAALTTVALGVAACGPETNQLTPISNPSVYSVNQPVVQQNDYVLDLQSGYQGLPVQEQGRLAGWFEGLNLRYGDKVYLQDGGYDAVARDDVGRIAADFGVLLEEGTPASVGPVSQGGVRVVLSRASASVPGCPIWEDPQIAGAEQTSTNYGCATNSNLARMVADPNDLVRGQTTTRSSDSMAGTKAIQNYRNRQTSNK